MDSSDHAVGVAPIRTFAGAPQEVSRQLDHAIDGQIVVVVLDQTYPSEAKIIEQVLVQIVQLTQRSLVTRDDDTLSALVATLLPKEMPSAALVKEAKMLLRAKQAVLTSGDWLSAEEFTSILGPTVKNPSAQLRRWEREGAIFAICHDGTNYFPGYALDPQNEYRPYRELKKVIAQFAMTRDGWGLAFWFQSANSFLGGKRPKETLASQLGLVIAAAKEEVMAAVHA